MLRWCSRSIFLQVLIGLMLGIICGLALPEFSSQLKPLGDGFIKLIQNHIHNLPYLTALMEYWRVISREDPAMVAIYARRDAILQPLIDTAIQHQICRPDLSAKDYAMITAILRTSFQGLTDTEQQQLAQRAIELLLNGIRA
mgnify:CR=1 FL=1